MNNFLTLRTQEASIYSWIVAARYLILPTSSQAASWVIKFLQTPPLRTYICARPWKRKEFNEMSKWSKKKRAPGTFNTAELVTRHAEGEGRVIWKPSVVKGSFQKFIQVYPAANHPWPVVSCSSHFVSPTPPCLLWLLSLFWTLICFGDLAYYPYLTFASTFTLCSLCPLDISVTYSFKQRTLTRQLPPWDTLMGWAVPPVSP